MQKGNRQASWVLFVSYLHEIVTELEITPERDVFGAFLLTLSD